MANNKGCNVFCVFFFRTNIVIKLSNRQPPLVGIDLNNTILFEGLKLFATEWHCVCSYEHIVCHPPVKPVPLSRSTFAHCRGREDLISLWIQYLFTNRLSTASSPSVPYKLSATVCAADRYASFRVAHDPIAFCLLPFVCRIQIIVASCVAWATWPSFY